MPDNPAGFDAYAQTYEDDLRHGLKITGESKDYFARQRVRWLSRRLDRLGVRPDSVLDFGCGTGGSITHLRGLPGVQRVVGVDPSAASIDIARRDAAGDGVSFATLDALTPDASFDLAFCNGVFHHIEPGDRPEALRTISRCLRPGGLFALWENNPLNPGTRWVMSRCRFDHDAQPFTARQGRRMLRDAGFGVVHGSSLFFFPAALAALRCLEPALSVLPVGGQYLILSRRLDLGSDSA